jgi:predicted phage replisome organizer
MGNQKFYWLKLKRDFFKRHDIRIIEEMPNGKDYVLFYLKLLLESIDHGGHLRFNATIPYNEQMLSVITSTNIDLVRSAMRVFIQLKMVEILDDETIYMTEVQKMTGAETAWAQKKRLYRGKQEEDEVRTLSSSCPPDVRQEIELEIELEIDTELETEREKGTGADAPALAPTQPKRTKPERQKHGEFGWVLLNQEQYACLLADLGAEELSRCIRYIDESAQSNGNKNKWRDWNLVIRRCSREGWGRNARQAAPDKVDALGVLNRMLEEGE